MGEEIKGVPEYQRLGGFLSAVFLFLTSGGLQGSFQGFLRQPEEIIISRYQ